MVLELTSMINLMDNESTTLTANQRGKNGDGTEHDVYFVFLRIVLDQVRFSGGSAKKSWQKKSPFVEGIFPVRGFL